MAETLMVWIDQDLCTGDGICQEICPDVFVGRDDGLWVVKEEASHFGTTIVFDGGDGPGHGRLGFWRGRWSGRLGGRRLGRLRGRGPFGGSGGGRTLGGHERSFH